MIPNFNPNLNHCLPDLSFSFVTPQYQPALIFLSVLSRNSKTSGVMASGEGS